MKGALREGKKVHTPYACIRRARTRACPASYALSHPRPKSTTVSAHERPSLARWRRVFRLMEGFGEWLQLSVFQCRLSAQRHAELIALLDDIIHHDDDHVILMDLGPADQVTPRVVSLGKDYTPLERKPVVV